MEDIFEQQPKKPFWKTPLGMALIITAAIVIVIVVVFLTKASQTGAPPRPTPLTEEEKLRILSDLASGDAPTMTLDEKQAILKELSSGQEEQGQQLTQEEKFDVLRQLQQ